MTESTAQPTPASAEPHVAEPSKPQDFNPARARKVMTRLERENADLKSKLAEMEQGQQTEAEKRATEAYNRGKTETETQFTQRIQQLEIDGAVTRAVLAAGFPEDVVHIVKAKIDVDDPKEVAAEVTKVLATLDWAKPNGKATVPGQPGAPSVADATKPEYPKNGAWDRSQIQEVITRGLYPKYKDAIETARTTTGIKGGIGPSE